MSACKHCQKCKNGCDFCSCCGKCQRCDNVRAATVNPGPVFVPYPVYPTFPVQPWPHDGVIFRTEPEPPFYGATITCGPHDHTGRFFTSRPGGPS